MTRRSKEAGYVQYTGGVSIPISDLVMGEVVCNG
jgi:hypothetical protein